MQKIVTHFLLYIVTHELLVWLKHNFKESMSTITKA